MKSAACENSTQESSIGRPLISSRSAFTLFEVMLSLLLVALLLYGVDKVFTTASDAVGAGQFINSSSRDSRATQSMLFGDLGHIRLDMPIFISCQRVTQFLNLADAEGNYSTNPGLVDTTNSGGANATAITPGVYNYRSHQDDTISFFATEQVRRRTGDTTSYLSSMTSQDLYVWLGHAAQPGYNLVSGSTVYYTPEHVFSASDPNSNPRNRYGGFASDWILARAAILMKDPSLLSGLTYYAVAAAAPAAYSPINLTPLGYGTLDTGGLTAIQTMRYDVAGVTLEQFRQIVGIAYNQSQANAAIPPWWNAMVYPSAFTAGTANLEFNRFQYNPIYPPQLTTATFAQMAPHFLEHASQFIVEYAGDYVTQDANGNVIAANGASATTTGPDGQVDYNVVNGVKMVRWYGLPRSTTSAQVLPLFATLGSFTLSNGATQAPFEVDTYNLTAATTYSNMAANARYVCAFVRPQDMPAMIRILVKVDDPNNRIEEGPWYEYVFQLK